MQRSKLIHPFLFGPTHSYPHSFYRQLSLLSSRSSSPAIYLFLHTFYRFEYSNNSETLQIQLIVAAVESAVDVAVAVAAEIATATATKVLGHQKQPGNYHPLPNTATCCVCVRWRERERLLIYISIICIQFILYGKMIDWTRRDSFLAA